MIAVLCCCFLKPHEFSMAVGLIENPVEVYGKYVWMTRFFDESILLIYVIINPKRNTENMEKPSGNTFTSAGVISFLAFTWTVHLYDKSVAWQTS